MMATIGRGNGPSGPVNKGDWYRKGTRLYNSAEAISKSVVAGTHIPRNYTGDVPRVETIEERFYAHARLTREGVLAVASCAAGRGEQKQGVPVISIFFGIVIRMFYREHGVALSCIAKNWIGTGSE